MKLYQHYQIEHPNELAEKESGMSYVREYIKYLCKVVKFFSRYWCVGEAKNVLPTLPSPENSATLQNHIFVSF